MSEGLKPCPFCGKTVSIARMYIGEEKAMHYIYHAKVPRKCMVFLESKPFPDDEKGENEKAEIIEAWNRRANKGEGMS